MDQKQFERMQQAVQWVVDEDRWINTHGHDDNPDHLDHLQGYWGYGKATSELVGMYRVVCASGCCVAGNGILANGDKMVVRKDITLPAERVEAQYCADTRGNLFEIAERAQALFGLDNNEARDLFDGDNCAETIVQVAASIAKDHGYELEVI